MKTFVATVLAAIASVSLAAAPAATPKPDLAAYHAATQKAAADYKVAAAKCGAVSGNAKTVCAEEARAARAHSEVDAVAQYNNTPKTLGKARGAAADADYALAKAKCAEMSGADKDRCVGDAKSAHAAALAAAAPGGGDDAKLSDKARSAATTVVDKTGHAVDLVADKTAVAADKTAATLADSVITSKVKADIFKEPDLKSLAIHVETDKGVVMLSGFVGTKADADKAVQIAKRVNGVSAVKSALQVK